jgi:type IV fimbrial biogenesis protein FimT
MNSSQKFVRQPVRARSQKGFTLTECLMALTVTATSLGAGLPGFERALEQRRLEGAAAQLETDIAFTRSLAVARSQSVRMNFTSDANGTCYTVHTGGARDCQCTANGQSVCVGGGQAMRTAFFAAGGPVSLRSNVPSILFDPTHGTSTPTGTLRVVGRSNNAIHQIVNIMGRVRSCAPAPGLAGYPRC